MLTTAFHTGFLIGVPVGDAVRMIRDYGYDRAELNAELLPWTAPHVQPDTSREVRRELAQLGPFAALSAHHADYGHHDSRRNEAAIAHTRGLMDLATDLEIAVVHVIAGENAERDALLRALDESMRDAERRSITLAIEPIVNRIVGTRASTVDLLGRLPGLKVNFDPSHLQVMDHDVVSAVEQLGPEVVHVHLKDAVGSPNDFAFVPLGQGDIDFDEMLVRLTRHGYGGAVSIEHESHYFAGDDRPVDQVLRESKEFLDRLLTYVASRGGGLN
jgi:sugar phosphate isomerase/epimerase